MLGACIACFLILVVSANGQASEGPLQPGLYILEGGSGDLSIKRGRKGGLVFTILTVGPNAHTCSLDGKIHSRQAVLRTDNEGEKCIIDFLPKGNDIEVTGTPECREYCGMRAHFDGTYLKPPKGCEPIAVQKTRDRFKRLYEKKFYTQAQDVLQKVLADCSRTLGWLETRWILNDLAITQYRLNDFEGCRKTLEPLAADAAKTDDKIREEYPPADYENYLPAVRAARHNLGLCGKLRE